MCAAFLKRNAFVSERQHFFESEQVQHAFSSSRNQFFIRLFSTIRTSHIKRRSKRRILLKRLLRLCSLLFLILFLFLFFLFLHPLYKYFAFFFDPFLVCLPIFSRRFNHHKCTNKYSCHNEIHPKRYRHFPPLLTCPHLLHLMRRKRCLFL